MAWTFVCPTEILAFSDRIEDFKKRNATVVFASTDSEYSLLAWTNTSKKEGGLGQINIPLYADKNHSLSKDYGVLIEEEGIALRGLFLIDPNGVVRQVSLSVPNPKCCFSSSAGSPSCDSRRANEVPACAPFNCWYHLVAYADVPLHSRSPSTTSPSAAA
jgi:hypothetical protein